MPMVEAIFSFVAFPSKSPLETDTTLVESIRVGVPAVTTRGMNEAHMETIVGLVDKVLMHTDDETVIEGVKKEVKAFMKEFPLYPELG